MDLWNNVRMRTVREQMCRGDYSACSEYLCPLVRLPDIGPVPKKLLDVKGPRHVKLSFDRGCNLHCRSCRESGKIIKTDDQIVHNLLRLFERDLSQSVQFLEAEMVAYCSFLELWLLKPYSSLKIKTKQHINKITVSFC